MTAKCGECGAAIEFETAIPTAQQLAANPFLVVVFPKGDKVTCGGCGAVYKLEVRASSKGAFGVAGVLQKPKKLPRPVGVASGRPIGGRRR